MLAAGQTEKIKSALSRLVTRVEVHEDPRPGRKRPGAYLLLRGNLQAALQLAGEKGTSGCSPGGLRTLVTIQTPARGYRLQGRWFRPRDAAVEQRQAIYGG
jgi:hypothetical protein